MARGLDITRRMALGGLALAGLGAPLLSACLGEGQELSLAIWRDYLGETTLNDFYRATGIKGLGTVRDAAIVAADAPGDGKAVIALEVTGVETDMCVAVEPDVLKAVAADPGKYHVVVRSAANPKGAARGVLGK